MSTAKGLQLQTQASSIDEITRTSSLIIALKEHFRRSKASGSSSISFGMRSGKDSQARVETVLKRIPHIFLQIPYAI